MVPDSEAVKGSMNRAYITLGQTTKQAYVLQSAGTCGEILS